MKKFLLTMMCLLGLTSMVNAKDVVFDFTAPEKLTPTLTPINGSYKEVSINDTLFTNGSVTFKAVKGQNTSTNNRIWTNKTTKYELRGYTGSTFTFTAGEGETITNIVLAGSSNKSLSATEGTFTEGTWTGAANQVVLTVTGSLKLTTMTVTVAEKGTIVVAAPEFSMPAGVYTEGFSLRTTTSTENAKVYITTDGTEPTIDSKWNRWGTFIESSCTVKAVTVLVTETDTVYSDVVSANYIISEMKPYRLVANATSVRPGKVLFVADSMAAGALDRYYGDLPARKVAVQGNAHVEDAAYFAFDLEAVEGGYALKDYNGKYLYMKDTYNNFNLSDTFVADGGVWTITIEKDSTAKVLNNKMQKFMQFKGNSFGSFADLGKNVAPKMYALSEYPTITVAPSVEEQFTSLDKFTVTCEQGLALSNNEEAMAFMRDAMWQQIMLTAKVVDDKTIEFTTEAPITAEGMYTLNIDEGFLVLDPKGLAQANEAVMAEYSVIDPTPFTATDVDLQENAELDSIQHIIVTYSHAVEMGWSDEKQVMIVSENNDTISLMMDGSDAEGNFFEPFNRMRFFTETAITTPGKYTLTIPKEFVVKGSDYVTTIAEDIVRHFTIKDATGIQDVEAADEAQVIYDLTGRRINAITKTGLYIVNGKKMIVRK